MSEPANLYFVHLSIHGLIRGHDLELGRDADTGGQCKYVVELIRALAKHPRIGQVDLFTRRVIDPRVSDDYSQPVEDLGDGAFIRRITAGPRRYVRKESLWRYLDGFVDQCLAQFRQVGRLPDVIHAHYADAGYVGSRLAALLGCPLIFTGHSLGRTKRERLLQGSKVDPERIDQRYNLMARIEAEEQALDNAALVCTSTSQEVEQQYAVYDCYRPESMRVIPPGVDISLYAPAEDAEIPCEVVSKIERFLDHPERPVVLAIARADEKKNLATLVKAFGESDSLRNTANLVLVAGNRNTIGGLHPGARKVWTELLQLIDDYDLYGIAAIPKHHEPDEIPGFYRYAARSGGVFVNPALTEPFGLTIIEAAASGLPVLATNDGGPRDILQNCRNGLLIDPLDRPAMTAALEAAFADPQRRQDWARAGLAGVRKHYTWPGHVERYLEETSELLQEIAQPHLITEKVRTVLPLEDRIVFTGLPDELREGDRGAISDLRELFAECGSQMGFGIASGRDLESARTLVAELGLPQPDVYITQLGGEIHYGVRVVPDQSWEAHLSHRWEPAAILDILAGVPGLTLQPEEGRQHHFKISYVYEQGVAPRRREIQKMLREKRLRVKVLLSEGRWLDVIPLRSGKGQAIRFFTMRWGIPAEKVLYYARRGSDYEALSGGFLGVLAAEHSPELMPARSLPRVYAARQPNFTGLLEGLRAFQFDDAIRVPEEAGGLQLEDAEVEEAVLGPDIVAHRDDEL